MDSLTFFTLLLATGCAFSLVRTTVNGILSARNIRRVHDAVRCYKRAVEAAHRRIS